MGCGEIKLDGGSDGSVETVEVLSQCDDDELVFTYAQWVIRKNMEQGIKVSLFATLLFIN